MFNNFEKNRFSTKQLWTAASSFSQKCWWYLIKHIFVGQNIYKSKLLVIFVRQKCHEFPTLEGAESQDKSVHTIFISNSIFNSSLRLLREDVNFRLKVANKLLTR